MITSTMTIGITLIALGILLLMLEFCTRVADIMKWACYKEKVTARICSMEEFSAGKSRRVVEKQEKGAAYEAIRVTQDKSVHYLPIFTDYGNKKKRQVVFQWSADGINWRAHYPYLQNQNRWAVGEKLELRYSVKRPWSYAIRDGRMWRNTVCCCLIYICFCIFGFLMI